MGLVQNVKPGEPSQCILLPVGSLLIAVLQVFDRPKRPATAWSPAAAAEGTIAVTSGFTRHKVNYLAHELRRAQEHALRLMDGRQAARQAEEAAILWSDPLR